MPHDPVASPSGSTPAELGRAVAEQVARVIVGKADQTRLITVALLADGHVLCLGGKESARR